MRAAGNSISVITGRGSAREGCKDASTSQRMIGSSSELVIQTLSRHVYLSVEVWRVGMLGGSMSSMLYAANRSSRGCMKAVGM